MEPLALACGSGTNKGRKVGHQNESKKLEAREEEWKV